MLVPFLVDVRAAVHPLADAADEAGRLQPSVLLHAPLGLGREQARRHLGGGALLAALPLPLLSFRHSLDLI